MDWGDEIYNKIQSFEDEFIDIVRKTFKGVPRFIGSTSSSIEPITSSINIDFPRENSGLTNSEYFLKETKKIIHFTSLKVLYSIINEQAIRLYNLNNSNDSTEYLYAAKYFGLLYKVQGYNQDYIDAYFSNIKNNAFILSATEIKEFDNLFFWKEYGDYGRGIAIEFEIINDPLKWYNFYFSKVIYGKLTKIKTLIRKTIDLQIQNSKNKYFPHLEYFFGIHKSPRARWQNENEIRILTYFTGHNRNQIFHDIKYSGKNIVQTTYFSLPLYTSKVSNEREPLEDRIPILKISKIYFGPEFQYSNDKLFDYMSKLSNYMAEKLGYTIEIFNFRKILK